MGVSYSKGLNLELIIADLFRKNGYTVIHNLKKKGKSGVEHQIDVYAEYKAPLHTSSVIIEAKSYEESIDKDKIMKFVQIVDDLNVDRGIFVTTSDYVLSAIMTANQYNNIELWNRDKISKLVGELQLSSSVYTEQQPDGKIESRIKTISPRISHDQVQQYVTDRIKKREKGGFLGSGKVFEESKSTKLLLYPYYDFGIKARVQHIEKRGLLSSEAVDKIIPCRVSVDAITCGIIDVTSNGISYRYSFPQITEEEAKLLRIFRKGFEMKTVTGLGLGDAKAKRIVNGLVSRGVLNASNTRPVQYILSKEYPEDPSTLNSLREVYQITDLVNENATIIEPKIEPAQASKLIESYLDAKVEDIDLVYYPFYEVWYGRQDGSIRAEVLDGIFGTVNERIASMLT